MPKPEPVDITKPLPDEAHEGIRLGVIGAIADLGDTFLLVDTLFGLSDEVRGDVGRGRSDTDDLLLLIDTLFGLVDSVQARVAALEAAPPSA